MPIFTTVSILCDRHGCPNSHKMITCQAKQVFCGLGGSKLEPILPSGWLSDHTGLFCSPRCQITHLYEVHGLVRDGAKWVAGDVVVAEGEGERAPSS